MAFRKKIYHSLDELQGDVNEWLKQYNGLRPHSGKYCYGKTPMQTFTESKHLADEKNLSLSVDEQLEKSNRELALRGVASQEASSGNGNLAVAKATDKEDVR